MYKKYWLLLSIIVLSCVIIYVEINKDKLGYVRSAVLIEKYYGMQAMRTELDKNSSILQANIDTLKLDLQRNINQYNSEYLSMSKEERKLKEEMLYRQENELKKYIESVNIDIEKREQELFNATLSQINASIEEYGKQHNFDYIFGTTSEGSLVYAKNCHDLTEELIKKINLEYSKGR